MADISDVDQAVVNLITSLVYPNGPAAPSMIANDSGLAMPVRIFRGWPMPTSLDLDLAEGVMNISVFSAGGKIDKNITKFPPEYQTISVETPTVSASVNAQNQIVITGAGAAGIYQYVTVIIGTRVVVSYSVQSTDTAATIAQTLAAMITAAYGPATATGGVITVTYGSPYMVANVGVTGNQAAEWMRVQTTTQITIWSPTPIARDNAAKALIPTFSKTTFLTMPDDFQARFKYEYGFQNDGAEKVNLYRRDMVYGIEYAVTDPDTAYQITSVNDNVKGSQGDLGTAPNNFNYLPTVKIVKPNLWPGPPYTPVVR